ncbi:uncharacterized protein TNCV_2699021 [Trichonephila clavipes]|nr:uncharacterized protein TNCV_2699021 [Trichonephila clavipes]
MIGRADIEESISDVDMNSQPPRASYPSGNFSDTSPVRLSHRTPEGTQKKGSMGPCFQVPFPAEERDRAGFCPFAPRRVSVPTEPALGHLRCHLTDVPPQTNCLPDAVFGVPRPTLERRGLKAHTFTVGFPESVPVLVRLFPVLRHCPSPYGGPGHLAPYTPPRVRGPIPKLGPVPATIGASEKTRGCSPWRPAADMGTAGHENHKLSLGFSRAGGGAPDTAAATVLFRQAASLSPRDEIRGTRASYKEKATLLRVLRRRRRVRLRHRTIDPRAESLRVPVREY